MSKRKVSQKVIDSANLAHYGINLWARVGASISATSAISVTLIMGTFPEINRYRARQIQTTMFLLGLIRKADNGRYYRVVYPEMFDAVYDVMKVGEWAS